jgi:hypothetical protein
MFTKDLFSAIALSAVALYVSGCLGAFTYLGLKAIEHSQTQTYLSAAIQPEMPATLSADYRHYVEEVQARVQQHCWVSPDMASRMIQLTVDRSGNVTDLWLAAAGTAEDKRALQAVNEAAPFAPLPATSPSKVHLQIKLGQARLGSL